MRALSVWLVVVAGCGRVGFDPSVGDALQTPTGSWTELDGSSTGGGVSQLPAGVTLATVRVAVGPSGRPVVAWTDDLDGDWELHLRAWNGAAWIELGGSATAGGISNDAELTRAGGLAVTAADQPCITWRNHESATLRLACWNGTTWAGRGGSEIGIATAGQPWWPDLDLDPQPIVAWEDYGAQPSAILLRRFDGTAWNELGGSATGSGVSGTAGPAWRAGLEVARDGSVWVSWERSDNGDVFAASWNGAAWVSTNVTGTPALSERHAFDIGATPYIVWMEDVAGSPAIYMRAWNGTSWDPLGGSATGTGIAADAFYPGLAVGVAGEPIIAYAHAGDIYVVRWDGQAWSLLGEQQVPGGISSSGAADWPELAVGPDGSVFVLWEHDDANQNQTYLKVLAAP